MRLAAQAGQEGRAGEGQGQGLTLLEFICARLLGEPVRQGQPGESWWRCPLHDDASPSFHTLPLKEGEREFWRCFGCGSSGDVYQLMRDLRRLGHPECRGNWSPHHQAKVSAWAAEWRRLNASTREGSPNPSPAPAPRAAPRACAPPPADISSLVESVEAGRVNPMTAGLGHSTDVFDIEGAYRDATQRQREALSMAFVLARTAGVDLVALCRYANRQELDYVRWLADLDKSLSE
jgi:hypothetical protein